MAQEFVEQDLRGARFVESDLSGAVIRGCEISGMEIDAPWLVHGEPLLVNGVDVVGFVEAELDRRFPGRGQRTASDPAGLRDAWAAAERAWDATIARAGALPPGSVDVSVDGEWSFAQTLRHLVHGIDLWLGRSVLGREELHPLGLAYAASDTEEAPSYDDVLAARASRVAIVRDYLAEVTDDVLDEPRPNPHDPNHQETVRHCLHVVLEESWEHLRFATRDLDAIEKGT